MINDFDDEEAQITIHSEESLETINGIPFNQPLNIIIEDVILSKIQNHVVSNLQIEMGGVIIGRVYSQNGITYVDATDIISIEQPDATFVSLKFDHKAWIAIDKKKNEHFADKSIVGWYHSHIGLGIFYSLSDISVHKIAFPEKWQFGIVVDPINQNQGVFAWHDNQKIVQSTYFVSKSVISSQVQLSSRSDLTERIQLLESFSQTMPGFSELKPYFGDLLDNLSSSKISQRKLGYPHLAEIAKVLRFASSQPNKIKLLLSRLDQFFDQEFYLSLELLQVYFAALPENTSLIALGDWAYALLSNNTILAVNSEVVEKKIKMRILRLPWHIEKIFSLQNEFFGIDSSGTCYKFIHNDQKFEQEDELVGMVIGTINNTVWRNIGGAEGVITAFASKNDIIFCCNGKLYNLISDDDLLSLELAYSNTSKSLIKTVISDNEGNIFILYRDGRLSKLDDAGKKQWTISRGTVIHLNDISLFAIYNSYVVILDLNIMHLFFFDVERGKYLRRYRLASWLISRGVSGIFASHDALYIFSGNEVYRVGI